MDDNDRVLGVSRGVQRIDRAADLADHCCCMTAQCRRRIRIYTHRLNPLFYEQGCFVEAVRRLLVDCPYAQVQLLIADVDWLGRSSHRLLDLAQQMTSKIELRQRAEAFSGDQRSFMLIDDRAYILRAFWGDLEDARVSYADGARARELGGDFSKAWEISPPASALRRLHL